MEELRRENEDLKRQLAKLQEMIQADETQLKTDKDLLDKDQRDIAVKVISLCVVIVLGLIVL